MEPKEISALLNTNTQDLKDFFGSQDAAFWSKELEGKWTPGQHVIHLVQSSTPLLKALKMPKFLLKWKFGKNSRATRNLDEIVEKYHTKLSERQGLVSPFSVNMPTSEPNERSMWFEKLTKLNEQINAQTQKISPKDLDTILLPHPLLGKLTLREILMWNTYHTKHHHSILKQKYI
ncbi:MAG: DinB family protein [Saprospiraceae bacterium]